MTIFGWQDQNAKGINSGREKCWEKRTTKVYIELLCVSKVNFERDKCNSPNI